MTVIWWIRRDLRLSDNRALHAALENATQLVPLFILDPTLLAVPADKRQAFLFEGLRRLDADLRARGSRLIVRRGQPLEVLTDLLAHTGAHLIVAEEDYSPYAVRRDTAIAARLPLQLVAGPTVHSPHSVLKADGKPYTVFTPFSRAWQALPLPDGRDLLPSPAALPPALALDSLELPSAAPLADFQAGEFEAQRRLRAFVDGPIFDYAQGRNRLDQDGTSGLSPYLRFGMLSARQAVVAAMQTIRQAPDASARTSARTWLNELVWREFYAAIVYHFPDVLRHAFRPNLRRIAWVNNPEDFAAWCEGRTGYPVVDAAMRQLRQTGWMHNRARMIAASFLVKDLLIDWRWGERWFMQHLVDGDPASNNGGWQWTAGVGTDAAPYFRVFNPVLQGEKFDPDGAFVRRWLPELANVPTRFVHRPWQMPSGVQRSSECIIGHDYPPPLVDHRWARERALAVYGQARFEQEATRDDWNRNR